VAVRVESSPSVGRVPLLKEEAMKLARLLLTAASVMSVIVLDCAMVPTASARDNGATGRHPSGNGFSP
jgi:hypothetical protein